MDLNEKPLYALRDLARRLGISRPTEPNKAELIELIEERKKYLEEYKTTATVSRLGRPLLDNSYIAIKTDENGKITFYDTKEPQPINYAEKEKTVIRRPLAIKDEETRKSLKEIKKLMQKFCLAIDKVLERE